MSVIGLVKIKPEGLGEDFEVKIIFLNSIILIVKEK